MAAEELGADGAYFRVHHFAEQLASPFPLLAAVGARTSRIEIGTADIDMRYENPFYMVESASAADLISDGRLQLGISRGSPEQVIDGWRCFPTRPGYFDSSRRELPAEQEFRHQRRDTVAGNEDEAPVRPGDTDDLGAPQLVPDPRL